MQTIPEVKIPKVECKMVVSEFNQRIQDIKERRIKQAQIRREKEKDQQIMNKVLAGLGKKDSFKVLLENYEATLHQADKVNDSPTQRSNVNLVPNLKQLDLY